MVNLGAAICFYFWSMVTRYLSNDYCIHIHMYRYMYVYILYTYLFLHEPAMGFS